MPKEEKIDFKEVRSFVEKTIVEAGTEIMKYYGKESLGSKEKTSKADIVTNADHASNKIICDAIAKKYPNHTILSEEGEHVVGKGYTWVIDPLDGTKNFSLTTPLFGVFIALVYNGEVIVGGCYLPVMKELFYAQKGIGLTLNGKRVYCSNEDLEHSYGAGSIKWSTVNSKLWIKFANYANKETFYIAALGSAALSASYTACGRRDWYVSSAKGGVWDFAVSALMLKEAGCKISKLDGSEWKFGDVEMVAANPVLHRKLISIINSK
ncbi:MAG TPA: inositol monophosphatase [Alphaproteobacteria bacterium]|nr:inositol monophosphatase [Alphaproteobacteria bacterium]